MIHKEPVIEDKYGLLFQSGVTKHQDDGTTTPYQRLSELDDTAVKERFIKLSRFLQQRYKGTKYYLSAHHCGTIYYAVDAVKGENFLWLNIHGSSVGLRKRVFTEEFESLLKSLFPDCNTVYPDHYMDKEIV